MQDDHEQKGALTPIGRSQSFVKTGDQKAVSVDEGQKSVRPRHRDGSKSFIRRESVWGQGIKHLMKGTDRGGSHKILVKGSLGVVEDSRMKERHSNAPLYTIVSAMERACTPLQRDVRETSEAESQKDAEGMRIRIGGSAGGANTEVIAGGSGREVSTADRDAARGNPKASSSGTSIDSTDLSQLNRPDSGGGAFRANPGKLTVKVVGLQVAPAGAGSRLAMYTVDSRSLGAPMASTPTGPDRVAVSPSTPAMNVYHSVPSPYGHIPPSPVQSRYI